jgi:Zn-dependent M16 (insulinase) family peptidase
MRYFGANLGGDELGQQFPKEYKEVYQKHNYTQIQQAGIDRICVNGDEETLYSLDQKLNSWPLISQKITTEDDYVFSDRNPSNETFSTDKWTYFALPIQVNHSALCIPTIPYTHEDSPKLRVLGSLMSSCYLHREIREKGGAYGSGSRHSFDGFFSFFSYR